MNTVTIANHLYRLSASPARAAFERAVRNPARAQLGILSDILRNNAECEFGKRHDYFRGIRSVADFQRRIPLSDFDSAARDVDLLTSGAPRVLTEAPVRCLEPTGGSSGPVKLIPYTRGLLREFSRATQAWVFDLLQSRPALRHGRAYWAVTPPARRASHTDGGIPIGLDHDSDYFPAIARVLLDRSLGLPRVVGRAPDVVSCRYLTLRALLALPDLAFISVWNPSFLTLLAQSLDQEWRRLLADLSDGDIRTALPSELRAEVGEALGARPRLASALRRRFGRRPPENLGELWPRLALISCWTDGHAARALDGMRERFPQVEVQGKGLLATEGVVSIPLFASDFPIAAVTSHFLEFLPHEDGVTSCAGALTVDQVELGKTYEVVLTTSGGLYRYRLRDLVRVEGYYRATPMLTFVGRADCASDVAGEKLTPAFVERVLADASRATGVRPSFAMMAPTWGSPPRYHLYVEADDLSTLCFTNAVERLLMESHHYALCRVLGQLDPVQGVLVRDGARVYERARVSRGLRAGAVKPVALDSDLGWNEAFAGALITTHDALVAS